MKILMVCTENLPVPPVLGGAIQTYISGSLPYLSKNHDITIMGINDPSLPNEEIIDGVKYVRVPGKVLEVYREGVVKYIESSQFDLIHIFNRPRLVLPIRKVAPNSKITLSMHNDMFNLGKIDPEEAKLVIEEVSNIVTVSDYVGNVIRELYPEASSKIRTIYSGVDSNRFLPGNDSKMSGIRNTLRKEHGLENKTVILFAGRLSVNKGVDRLINALPQLSKTFKDLALVIVGSNWFSQNNVTDYVAYIRAITKKQEVPVITTGFVSPYEIQNWFAAADIFVCTSLWQEPLARVHYEAMAAGLPIVTTARGGNPEVITPGENGLIVQNPEDPSEFAEKITEILSNKALMRNMSKNGRELAVSKYLWSRVANEILEVWNQAEIASANTTEELEQFESNLDFKTVASTQVEKESIQFEVMKQPKVKNTKSTSKEKEVKQKEVKQKRVKQKREKVKIEKVPEIKEMQPVQVQKEQEVTSFTPRKLNRIRRVTETTTTTTKKIVFEEEKYTDSNKQVNNQKGLRRIPSLTESYDKKYIS